MSYFDQPLTGPRPIIQDQNDPLSFGYTDRQSHAFNQRAAEESRAAEAARLAAWEQLNGPQAQQGIMARNSAMMENDLRRQYSSASGYSLINGQMYVKGNPVIGPRMDSNTAKDYFGNIQQDEARKRVRAMLGFEPLGLDQNVFGDPRFQRLPQERMAEVYGATGRNLEQDMAAEQLRGMGYQGSITGQDMSALNLGAKAMGLPDANAAMLAKRYNEYAQANGLPAIPFSKPRDAKLEVDTYRGMYGVHPGEAAAAIEERGQDGKPTGRYVVRSKDQYGSEIEVPIPIQAVIEGRRMIGAEQVATQQPQNQGTPEQKARLSELLQKAKGLIPGAQPNPASVQSGPPASLMGDLGRLGRTLNPADLDFESLASDFGGTGFYNGIAGAVNYPNTFWGYMTGQQRENILPYDPGYTFR